MVRKTKAVNSEVEFGSLLEKAGRQCQREYRLGRSSSFGRCQEKHLTVSTRPERHGPALLGVVKVNRSKRLFCQWCTKMLMADLQGIPNVTQDIPVEYHEQGELDMS